MAGRYGALVWILPLSVLMFVGSLVLVWMLIVRMPADYLTRDQPTETNFRIQHPVMRIILVVVKNAVGLLLVIAGIVMLLTPGQGVLSIFIGLTLLDFPGRRKLIRRMLCRRRVLLAVNKIRERAQRPPLETPSLSKPRKHMRGGR